MKIYKNIKMEDTFGVPQYPSEETYNPLSKVKMIEKRGELLFVFTYCWTMGKFVRIVFHETTLSSKDITPNVCLFLKNDKDTFENGWTTPDELVEVDKILEKAFWDINKNINKN